MAMTLATAWVRRGFAAEFPPKYEVDEVELGRIEKLARLQLQDAQDDLNDAQEVAENGDRESEDEDQDNGAPANGTTKTTMNDEDDLREYHLSDYDNDDEDNEDAPGQNFSMFGNVRSLAYHAPGEEDPYLVLPEGQDDSDDEREDLQVFPTDNLILAAKVEDEVAHLEVFVYEDDSDNLYVHHDIMLPAIPLCVEWIGASVGTAAGQRPHGNFAAIGTMAPEIEVWDLDIVDSMYPTMILGQQPEEAPANGEDSSSTKKKPKKKKKPKANDEYHVDAVLALAANKQHGNLVASGSADKTIKLWDLNTGKCAKSYTMHSGRVCSLDWHPTESTVLLSGSYDRTVIATDMQAPESSAPKWVVEADVEKVRWDIHNPNFFFVTTEAGTVHYFDSRNPPSSHTSPSKPVWTLQAHDSAVSAFDINPAVPGFLVTGSEDKKVKLWNIQDNKPGMVVSRNLEVGRVFSAQFAPDAEVAFRLSVAGSKGQVQVWDTSTNAAVRNLFADRVKMPERDVKDRIVGVNKDEDDSEDDDEEEDEDGGVGTNGRDGWESMDED